MKIYLLFLFFSVSLFSEPVKEYQKPNLISEDIWNDVQPYLLPLQHPLKQKLDKLFTSRVIENEASMEKAGFTESKPAQFSHAIIAENKKIKGYFFKFYSDEQAVEIESKQWIDRAFEARSLQQAIIDHGYTKYFTVPKKWIYPLPNSPESKGPYPKSFILVAEKIDLVRGRTNRYKWKTDIKPKMLNALWIITEQEGLIDSLVIHNLPFTTDNKLAFIDLEHHHKWPVPFYKLSRYLNSTMEAYWNNLIGH